MIAFFCSVEVCGLEICHNKDRVGEFEYEIGFMMDDMCLSPVLF